MAKPILIMGATSGIGAATVDEATQRNLPVRAFARSAGLLEPSDLIEPYPGDALDPDNVASALTDVSAVIYALGIKERLSMLWEEERLFSESTRILLEAMQSTDVRRLVVVTGLGAGRSKSALSLLERLGHKALLGRPYADKDRQEALIVESDLNWTIVRPVILTKGPKSGRLKVLREPAEWRNGLVSRRDVASYLVDSVENGTDIRADVLLSR